MSQQMNACVSERVSVSVCESVNSHVYLPTGARVRTHTQAHTHTYIHTSLDNSSTTLHIWAIISVHINCHFTTYELSLKLNMICHFNTHMICHFSTKLSCQFITHLICHFSTHMGSHFKTIVTSAHIWAVTSVQLSLQHTSEMSLQHTNAHWHLLGCSC